MCCKHMIAATLFQRVVDFDGDSECRLCQPGIEGSHQFCFLCLARGSTTARPQDDNMHDYVWRACGRVFIDLF